MSEFKNVRVVKKANVYFDGNVTSRSVIFEGGSKKTLFYSLFSLKEVLRRVQFVWARNLKTIDKPCPLAFLEKGEKSSMLSPGPPVFIRKRLAP